ncbi:hypothetical protein GCM10010415_30330 [Streptomyces atrovirens]|uniref:SDR family NAD(P)-dependent oxidoreductase n=1 Tax=Streptomyces atrovirens TaxID=285556 RepID=A0ABW0DXC7_9ACTN
MPRLIIVTGAGSGIGRATAERFAAHGDTVLLAGRRPDRLRATADGLRATVDGLKTPAGGLTASADGPTAPADGFRATADGHTAPAGGLRASADAATAPADGLRAPAEVPTAPPDGPDAASTRADVHCVAADLSQEAGALRLREHVEALGRPVDGVVCCAGAPAATAGDGGLKSVAAEWLDAYGSNVLTAVLTVEALTPLLADGASVVLYSSIAAYRGSAGSGAYGAAKSALHSYTHHLAARLGPRGVNVNAIAPGYVADTEFFGDRMTPARESLLIRQTALGRPGTPADVAGLAHFLCSPQGAYITSQILQVNGGSQHGV